MTEPLDPPDPAADLPAELLSRASQSIDVAPLDVARVVRVARTRRLRWRAGVGSALAVAAVVTGVSVATAGSDPAPTSRIAPADSTSAPDVPPFPAPPEGMKWVGQSTVVVAVPVDWPVTDSQCGVGSRGEVVNAAVSGECIFPSQTSGDTRVAVTASGDGPAVRPDRTCDSSPNGACKGALVFADQGVAVEVRTSGPGASAELNRILDSAMILPDGWTTVPFAPAGSSTTKERVAGLEEAGFVVEDYGEGDEGQGMVEMNPPVGSPVVVGATINLFPFGSTSTDLEGSWTVDALVGADGHSLIPDDYDEPLSVAFSRGKMRGTEACNGIQGTYEQTGARGRDLRIEIRVMTTAACDSPPLASRMSAVRHVSGLGAVRYLHAANWMIVAELRPGDGH